MCVVCECSDYCKSDIFELTSRWCHCPTSNLVAFIICTAPRCGPAKKNNLLNACKSSIKEEKTRSVSPYYFCLQLKSHRLLPHIASTNGSRAAWLFQFFPSFALAATLARLCSRCWCMRSSWNQIPVSTVCHLPGDQIKYLTKTRVCPTPFAITSASVKTPPFTLICDPFSGFPSLLIICLNWGVCY